MTKKIFQVSVPDARRKTRSRGFTLIELLVVVSIIALLVGILTPGIRAFKKAADGLKQKSRFHAMEVGLELFRKDYKDYPDSQVTTANGSSFVCGAQHLAEALVGRDKKGFDPETDWCAPLDDDELYSNGDDDQIERSLARRRGPYIELDDADIYELKELYGSSLPGNLYSGDPCDFDNNPPSPVFSDVFYKKKITTIIKDSSGTDQEVKVRVGTPVLYFKANSSSKTFRNRVDKPETSIDDTDYRKWIYNYEDNQLMFDLEVMDEPAKIHLYDIDNPHPKVPSKDGHDYFYEKITNPNAESDNPEYFRPYNPRTFMLISAGWDGIFGTNDDITNFKK
jgi:prepilin-type N-terminal cleavage/methylation domain-containing protein